MKRIPLSERRYRDRIETRAWALVDDEDYERLVERGSWHFANGYARCRENGRTVPMHRVVLGVEGSSSPTVDHINGDRLDNRRLNLRLCTLAENLQNQAARRHGASRFRGVSRFKNRWRAEVRRQHLGLFDDEIEAALAAQAFRDEHMPFALPDPALVEALGKAA